MVYTTKLSRIAGIAISASILSLTAVCAAKPAKVMATNVESSAPADNHAKANMLYALSADSGTYNENKLTLKGVKLVLYFTEAPKRTAGQISPAKFDEIWNMRIMTEKSNLPNAVLSLFDKDGNNNVIVELQSQSVDGDTLTYNVKMLKGKPDSSFGKATLFIDAFPCPVNGC